jgi:hypothetical protein
LQAVGHRAPHMNSFPALITMHRADDILGADHRVSHLEEADALKIHQNILKKGKDARTLLNRTLKHEALRMWSRENDAFFPDMDGFRRLFMHGIKSLLA